MSIRDFNIRPDVKAETPEGFGEYCRARWKQGVAEGAELLVILQELPRTNGGAQPAKTLVSTSRMPTFWLLKAAEVIADGSCKMVGTRPTSVEAARTILANLVEYHAREDTSEDASTKLALEIADRMDEAARAILENSESLRKAVK